MYNEPRLEFEETFEEDEDLDTSWSDVASPTRWETPAPDFFAPPTGLGERAPKPVKKEPIKKAAPTPVVLPKYLEKIAHVFSQDFILIARDGTSYSPYQDIYAPAGDKTSLQARKGILDKLQWIDSGPNPYTDILPENTRLIRRVGSDLLQLLIEVPPGLHTVNLANGRWDEPPATFASGWSLRMPWQYFLLSVGVSNENGPTQYYIGEEPYLFWSKNQINTIDDSAIVFPAFLPNVHQSNGSICLGSTYSDVNLPLPQRVTEFIGQFYSPESKFNYDLGTNYPSVYASNDRNGVVHQTRTAFTKWHRDSKDEFCYKWWTEWDNTDGLRRPQRLASFLQRNDNQRAGKIHFDGLLETIRWGY